MPDAPLGTSAHVATADLTGDAVTAQPERMAGTRAARTELAVILDEGSD
jgi:hypothetical protein